MYYFILDHLVHEVFDQDRRMHFLVFLELEFEGVWHLTNIGLAHTYELVINNDK